MTQPATRTTVLVAHPSADLYGSDRMMLESVAGFLDQGWHVTVTVPQTGPLVDEARRLGADVVVVPTPVLRKSLLRPRGMLALVAGAVAGLAPAVRLLRRSGVDAVYVNTLTIPLWLVVARLLRRPVVCHVHEAEASAPAVVRLALAAPLLLATEIVTNSRYSLGVLRSSLPRLERRSFVVPNGVRGPAAAQPARERLDTPLRLLYVGRLSPRKGVDVAVDALRLLLLDGVEARLDVVGATFPGYEWFERDLRKAAGMLPPDAVVFHGFTPDPWGHVEHADVVLVPSRIDEPFGNTAVEAGLAARPLVVSDSSGLREATAALRAAVLVQPGDPRALADGVLRVRDAWPAMREAALGDAELLRRRHAPQRYRSDVAHRVQRLLGPGPAPADAPAPGPIVVAVLTYRRPAELAELLPVLAGQAAACRPPASVLVVDNDAEGSARVVVDAAALPGVRYVCEPEPGIAAARNRALAECAADHLLVFVDDDERPTGGWLQHLVDAYRATGAAGIVGPVVSEFVGTPHPWVAAGRFFDRRRLPTGSEVDVAATNNLLLDLHQVRAAGIDFDRRYGITGGSDTLFTMRLSRAGARLVWCDEAVVVDRVPADRSTPRWVLARAFRMGNCWSRVNLELTTSPPAAAGRRVRLVAAGAVRLCGGAARWGIGALLRRADLRARGARTVARGAGLVTGAVGFVYAEYRRPAVAAVEDVVGTGRPA